MSKIGDLLKRQHRPLASLGFGLPGGTAPRRRMLVIVRCDAPVDESCLGAIRIVADAVVLVPGTPGVSVIDDAAKPDGLQVAVGVWTAGGRDVPSEVGSEKCDFVVCSMDGPVGAVLREDRGRIVAVPGDLEASRGRALAELGFDAVLVSADDVDVTRVSALVECRRIHSVTGRPVVLDVRANLAEDALAALWQVGVDALMVDLSRGCEMLRSLRSAVDRAPFASRSGPGGGAAVIGAYVGAMSQSTVHDDDEDDGEEEPDDD